MSITTLEPELLLMTFMRVSGFIFTAPVFGSQLVPKVIKVWASVLFALALVPMVDFSGLPAMGSLAYFVLAAREVLIGILIGFICNFFLHGVEFAGHVLGLQMGFAASTLFDPLSRNDVSVIGRFKGLLAIVLFLAMNGHHVMLSSFSSSYAVVPPSITRLGEGGGAELITATSHIFVVAVRVAIPTLSAIFMVQIGIAMLAKTMPQMNIFIVGFPLKIAVGLTVLGLSLPYFGYMLRHALAGTNANLRSVLGALSGG
jgi:flagellar biosynthetic protein FliR